MRQNFSVVTVKVIKHLVRN